MPSVIESPIATIALRRRALPPATFVSHAILREARAKRVGRGIFGVIAGRRDVVDLTRHAMPRDKFLILPHERC